MINFFEEKKSKFLKMLLGTYVGAATTFLFKVGFSDWKWWIFTLPTIFIMELAAREQSKEK